MRDQFLLKHYLALLASAIVLGSFSVITALWAADNDRVTFNADGTLARPEGYREWIYVGTPLTPNDMNDGQAAFPEFHSVYIDPASWQVYRQTGEFPDGTVLIKELISVGGKTAASGNGYFMGEFIGLEAAIKNSARFADEPGNWAYFSFTNADHRSLQTAAAALPTEACNACHQGAAAQDFVFTQYYPVLRAAKAAASQ